MLQTVMCVLVPHMILRMTFLMMLLRQITILNLGYLIQNRFQNLAKFLGFVDGKLVSLWATA